MRILYCSQFPNMVGGGEYSLLDLMSHLPKGVEPILVTPTEGIFTDKAKKLGIAHRPLPMPPLKQAKLSTFNGWRKAIRELKPDVIHANNSRAAFYAGLAGKQLGIPVIFHCRIADDDGLMDKILQRLVDVIVCNSKAVAQRFERFKKPVFVIYNGLNVTSPHKTNNPLPSVEKYMLFVGRVSPEKQVEHALEVFAKLVEDNSKLNFVIVGGKGPEDDGYMQNLRAWSDAQVWGERVHWIGFSESVSKWYAYAQILVLTSKHEGFGRVLVEAMGHSIPVVAYAVGGVPEVFEDGKQGVLVKPNDKQGMVDVCRDLLQHEAKRVEMGRLGKEHAQIFSIERHVERIMNVYKELAHD